MKKKRVLCINPWIYDFSAFDLWSKPLGLLYIAALLRQRGLLVDFIDCLDKWHPALLQRQKITSPRLKKYGTGHFHREAVAKPDALSFVPRKFARYGLPEDIFRKEVQKRTRPDVILLTSLMTYWYYGPRRVAEICREIYPGVPIILGGVYATLMPQHARNTIRPDHVIEGPGEQPVLKLLAALLGKSELASDLPENADALPYPAFDLLRKNDYCIVMSSRGCPFRCTFCATYNIDALYSQRAPDSVVREILTQTEKLSVRDVAFYDDVLLLHAESRIKPVLRTLMNKQNNLNLRFHTPNGLHGRYIDAELAQLLFRCNFKTLRISLESVAEERRSDMSDKITAGELSSAVHHLINAGYQAHELETYIIMGLPQQPVEEVVESVMFAHSLGIQVRMASFSPIPGTVDYAKAIKTGCLPDEPDPLLTNNTIIPLYRTTAAFERFQMVRQFANNANAAAREGRRLPASTALRILQAVADHKISTA